MTGGSGFIGSALVSRLVGAGHSVRVLDDNSRGHSRRLERVASAIEFVNGDVRDYGAVDAATRGMDAVAHLAFVNGTRFFYEKPRLVLEVGVKGAVNTLDAAIKHGVRRYWLMSSSEVYQTPSKVPTDETEGFRIPDPMNPRYSYGGGKIISELMAIHYGRECFEQVVIVRPHNVYGPDMGWEHVVPQFALRALDAARNHPEGPLPFPVLGDGTQTRSFVYIDDFADGCALAFTKGEHLGIYHLGTLDEVTIAQLATKIVRSIGREIDLRFGQTPKGETGRRCPDIARARGLGYDPKVSLDEGIRKTVDWYRANAHLKPADA